jgi:hypothetical protein
MKVFQVLHIYPPYIPHFEKKYDVTSLSFEEHRKLLIQDRFYALHILEPCLNKEGGSFYTLWDYENLQLKWAKEKGLQETDLKKILLAQIEEIRPDIFYTFSPNRFTKTEVNSLPTSLIKLCWSCAPGINDEVFKNYKTRLTNFPLDIKSKKEVGFRNDYFEPAYDPKMDNFSKNTERPIDLFFYGQYYEGSFKNRNEHLRKLIQFKQNSNLTIQFALQYTEKKEPVVNIPYIRRYLKKTVYPEKLIRSLSIPPLYGLDLYEKIAKSKIVFNAGVDFTKNYKVNMRNFEALGCGAHLISDEGIYSAGFEANKNFTTYHAIEEAIEKIKDLLENETQRIDMARRGHEMIKTTFSKETQWINFQKIIETL